jgi:hypothetical protein
VLQDVYSVSASKANQTAFIVHVSHLDEETSPVPAPAFYAALTTTSERAVALVPQAVKPEALVVVADLRLSRSTAHATEMMPDLAITI